MYQRTVSFRVAVCLLSALLLLPGAVFCEENALKTETSQYRCEYMLNEDGEALITDFVPYDLGKEFTLPKDLDGHPLVGFSSLPGISWVGVSGLDVTIVIPEHITQIPRNPFSLISDIRAFRVDDSHPIFESIDGVLYSKADKRLVAYPSGQTGDTYEVLPGTLVIGANAISDFDNLNVVLPESLERIEDYAIILWRQNTLELPKNLKHIGNFAFSTMPISQVIIPKGVTSIGDNPFDKCTYLSSIKVENGNKRFVMTKGVLFDKTEKRLIAYPAGMASEQYVVPKGTLAIAGGAFSRSQVDNLQIADSVKSIGEGAFEWSHLTQIKLPEGLESIGPLAFHGAFNLSEIIFPGQIKDMARGMFAESGLTSIEVGKGVESIGEGCFQFCQKLNQVALPNTVTHIGKGAFSYCESLEKLKIPASVSEIADDAFDGTKAILEVYEDSFAHQFAKEKALPFEVLPTTWSDSYTSPNAKGEPDYIEVMGNQYDELTVVLLLTEKKKFVLAQPPNYTITAIGPLDNDGSRDVFGGNTNCQELVLTEGLKTINDYCFSSNYGIQKIILPKTLESIGAHAFENNYITSLALPASVTHIGEGAFSGLFTLSKFTVDKNNPAYAFEKNMLIDKRTMQLVSYPFMNKKGSLTLPENITSIAPYAFSGSRHKEIKLPQGLTEIGSYAFFSTGLEKIQIPEGITEIQAGTFTGGTPLKTIELPASLVKIGAMAFQASALETIVLPEGLEEIGPSAFAHCKSLRTVEGLSGVKSVHHSAFIGCDALETRIP